MPRLRLLAALAAMAAAAIVVPGPASAAWPHDPNLGNVPICTLSSFQASRTLVSDGADGAIIVWDDLRLANYHVFAQRLNSAGTAMWTSNGVQIANQAATQLNNVSVADGFGGAIIAWEDYRSGSPDIYAQRVNSLGAAQWTANGVAVCAAALIQSQIAIVADGAGGAILAWVDGRAGGATPHIYAQRITSAGTPVWTTDGVLLSGVTGSQTEVTGCPDGAAGAIFAWTDNRSGSNDIYAQRLNASGVVQWTANGLAVATQATDESAPQVVADGAGGADIAWRYTNVSQDIYATRLTASGSALWSGVVVTQAANNQANMVATSDGSGGIICAWEDLRAGNSDIYAQRLSAGGGAVWTADGIALCNLTSIQALPAICADGFNGAIVGWQDSRGGRTDLYGQRVSSTGATQWLANGAAFTTAGGNQQAQAVVSDGEGGAIAAWQDYRTGGNPDIYAQRIERFGQLGNPEPAITGVKDVKNDQGGVVKLSWSASYLDVDPVDGVFDYRIWRSVPQAALASSASLGRGFTTDPEAAAADGSYLVHRFAGVDYAWQIVTTQSAALIPSYSMTAQTTSDSTATSNPRTAFMVEARAGTSVSSDHWFSAPDSGYSVDNLPPAAPAPLTGQYSAGVTRLHWNRNVEADLAGYRLYRGSNAAFVPSAANLVSALPDTGYIDAAAAPYIYKLTAVDAHGNESAIATLTPTGTVGVGDGAALELAFAPPSPNPARGSTTLEFTLPQSGHVRLSVFDAAGRRVQTLHDGEMAAGAHREAFALRDDAGRELAAGLYLVRLETAGRVITRRLAAVR